MSAPRPCSAQKSSISWVSRMPPIIEPAMLRRMPASENALEAVGAVGDADVDHGAVEA